MVRRLWFLLIISAMLSACQLGGPPPAPTHTRVPTNTPIPGVPTRNYLEVNRLLEAQGLPTLTPGPGIETLVFNQSRLTLEAILATSTPVPSATNTLTPQPTHTRVPSGTPVPGVATEVFIAINETLTARNAATLTPGPSRQEQVETLVVRTLNWRWAPTLTPTPVAGS